MKRTAHVKPGIVAGLLLVMLSLPAKAAVIDIDYEFVSTTHSVLGTNVLGISYQVDTSQGQTQSYTQWGYEMFFMQVNSTHNPVVSLPQNNNFSLTGYTETLQLIRGVNSGGQPTSDWRNYGGTGPYSIGTWVVPDAQPTANYYFQGGNATGFKIENRGASTWPYPTDVFSTVLATITETAPPPPLPGSTVGNPITQTQDCSIPAVGCFLIPVSVDPSGLGGTNPIYIDPVVATGYEYAIDEAGVFFDSVVIPEQGGLFTGDTLELLVAGMDPQNLIVGTTFDFSDLGIFNLSAFTIQGIDPDLGLLPDDPTAFITGLTFAGHDGTALIAQTDVGVSMNALTLDTNAGNNNSVPEPSTVFLLLLAGAAMGFSRRACTKA